MTAEEAVRTVTQFVIDTGTGAAEATRQLWPKLIPITDGGDELMQFAIATRSTFQYRRPLQAEPEPRRGGKIAIHHYPSTSRSYEVTVNLLRDVRYNVEGKVKPVASFTRHDLLTLAKNAGRFENGFKAYREFWTETAERLKTLKRDKVEDLTHGEQMKIARKLHQLQQHQTPGQLPSGE